MKNSVLFSIEPFTLILIIIVIIMLSSFASIYLFSHISNDKRDKKINLILSNKYYFIFSPNEKNVTIFNYISTEKKYVMDFDEFLNYLSNLELIGFRLYLSKLLSNKNINKYDKEALKLVTIKDNQKKSGYSRILFKFIECDSIKETIYLEGTFLHNLPCEETRTKRKFKNVTYSFGEIKKNYDDGTYAKGTSYIISIRRKHRVKPCINEYEIKYLILNSLFDNIKFISPDFYFKDEDKFEIDFLDRNLIAGYDLKRVIKNIALNLSSLFENLNLNSCYEFTVVGSLVSELYHDYDLSYKSLEETIEHNFANKKLYSTYKKEEITDDNKKWIIKNELLKIIKTNDIKTYFRPILTLGLNDISVYGYLCNYEITSEIFKNIYEVKKEARIYNNLKEIFSLCLKNTFPIYLSSRENFFSKIIIPTDFNDISLFLKVIPNIKNYNEAHIVFMIDAYNFLNEEISESVIDIIKNIQIKGYEVALKLSVGDNNVNRELLSTIDFFFVDLKLEENVKSTSKSFLSAYAFLEKLVIFNKKIISLDSKSFNEIYLLYRSGINIFSSDVIKEYDVMIAPIDKKINKKLTNIIDS